MKYLEEDNLEWYKKAKEHILDWRDYNDDASDPRPILCKCGKEAYQRTNMLWFCPELKDIPDEYFHPG